MAELSNRQGITISNPNWSKYAQFPFQPPEEEEEEQPEPGLVLYPLTDLQIYQKATDLKVISYKDCFTTPYISKLPSPLQKNSFQTLHVVIEDPESFNRPHLFIWISDDYDFSTGNGEFSQFCVQIMNKYDLLTEKPPAEVFPLILRYNFACPFNVGYVIDDPDPNRFDILTTNSDTKSEWVGTHVISPSEQSKVSTSDTFRTSTAMFKDLESEHIPVTYRV